MSGLVRHADAELLPDPARVVARLFLPGEEPHIAHSRAAGIVAHVLAMDEPEVERLTARLLVDFGDRHRDYTELLTRHASVVAAHVDADTHLSRARTLLLGASFTAEYATEGAALCNPSAVLHPDQTGLLAGQARIAVSLRGIGEGHMSSIAFAAAVVGPGESWTFSPRVRPVVRGTVSAAHWRREHLRSVLTDHGPLDELGSAVLYALPPELTSVDLEQALAQAHPDLLGRPGGRATRDLLRRLVSSAYEVEFDAGVGVTQRVLLPAAAEESNGMEDARFTRVVDGGTVSYRATYTAYDGRRVASRLLTSPDLRVFHAHRLAGPAARNKGMALFPRRVGGRHLALCRPDGLSTSLASSSDGFTWARPQLLHPPTMSWELLQVGNCGPPIETEQGWLVLTHGVGPMRAYAIGVLLLDLDDPSRVVARLDRPLLEATQDERDGYVPNVVYSCGAVVHDGRLWLPYGVGDARVRVAWVPLDELLAALTADS